MVAEGAAALEDREHLLVQAGTGTGKSLGYLVPLLTHCAVSGVRGLVSTATLALQRQILVKDAPVAVDAVASATGVRLKVAVLKGWSNYACMHKLDGGYPTEGTLFEDRDIGSPARRASSARKSCASASGSARPRRVTAMIWFPACRTAPGTTRRSRSPSAWASTARSSTSASRRPRAWRPPRPTWSSRTTPCSVSTRAGRASFSASTMPSSSTRPTSWPTACAPRRPPT